MPSPTDPSDDLDPHDPRVESVLLDNLALSALGLPVDPGFDGHAEHCRRCQAELAQFRQTVALAREAGHPRDQAAHPSEAVWDGIAAELGLTASRAPVPAPTPPVAIGVARRGWRAGLTAACAAVLLVVAGTAGYLLGDRRSGESARASAIAHLVAMPGGPAHVTGTAYVRAAGGTTELTVTTDGLPLREGYYEVWMFDPATNEMVAIGTLAQNGAGDFPMPPGLNPNAYHVVDVSAQKYDGNPAHQLSVLRGPLTS